MFGEVEEENVSALQRWKPASSPGIEKKRPLYNQQKRIPLP